jgi:hypothetical protein
MFDYRAWKVLDRNSNEQYKGSLLECFVVVLQKTSQHEEQDVYSFSHESVGVVSYNKVYQYLDELVANDMSI